MPPNAVFSLDSTNRISPLLVGRDQRSDVRFAQPFDLSVFFLSPQTSESTMQYHAPPTQQNNSSFARSPPKKHMKK